jgi:hypothetical protein
MLVSALCHCDRYLRTQLMGGKIYFDSLLQRLKSMIMWIHCLRDHHGGAELPT